MIDINGTPIDLKTGFTVHNQDGTSELIVYVSTPPTGGGGPGGREPMPDPRAA